MLFTLFKKKIGKPQPPRPECNWASIRALMENKEIYAKNILLCAIIFLITATAMSCKDQSSAPHPIEYPSLVNTKWKLTAIVDVENNISKQPSYITWWGEIPESEAYLLWFYDTNKLYAVGTGAGYLYNYSIASNNIYCYDFNTFIIPTAGEIEDGDIYFMSLSGVKSFSFAAEELKLYCIANGIDCSGKEFKNYKVELLFKKVDYVFFEEIFGGNDETE